MNARYYAFALSGRALTRLCQLPRGGATLCPWLWAVALSGRAFNLQGVHSTCKACILPARRAFYQQGVHSTSKACILPAYDLKYYVL